MTTPATANASVKIVENVHLAVTKTFGSDTVTAGGSAQTFTLDVTNSGLSDADNVHVTDTVDGRLLVTSLTGDFTCGSPSQSVDCSLGHLAAGATKTITVTYHVASTTDNAAHVSNEASASSDEDGPTLGSDTVDIVEDVQLSVTKEFDSATVVAGGAAHTFTVSVKNSGTSDADNVGLTDLVPSRLIVDNVSAGSYDCSATTGQSISCSLGHLAAGDTQSIVVTYHVDTTTEAHAAVTNTATASSDENAATSGSDDVAIAEDVNLVATKSFTDGTVDAGTTGHTFTISVENTGASQADNLHLTDSVDPRLVVTNVADGGFDCTASSGQSIDCSLAHLDSGDTKTVTVTYKVLASTAPATVTNDASATADDGGSDTASDSVDITTKADVADLKVATGSHIAGEIVTYTSTITNNGPSDAQSVTFTDPLDPSLTNALYCLGTGCTPGTAWTGSVGLGTIAAGETKVVVISATIDPGTPKDTEISNTSTAQSSTTTDPNAANNSSTADITVDTRADLSVSKAAPSTAIAGDPAGYDYTLTVHNAGPSNNSGGFHVSDTLPSGLTFDGGSAACSASGQDVTCSNTTGVAAGADKVFTVHVKADSTLNSGTVLENNASVTSDGTGDPASGNNGSNTTSTTIEENVKLDLTKSFDSATVTAGGSSQTFTITATNNGYSDADNVVLADTVDSRLVVDSISGDFSCGSPSQTISCTLGHLGAGESKSITVTYNVGASTAPASIDNHATVASDEDSTASNTASVEIVTAADLSITKTAPATATAGEPSGFDYTITVKNNGPSDNVGGFTVTDTLQSGLSFQTAGSDASCSASGQLVTCTHPAGLVDGDSATFTVHVKLASTVDSSVTLTNTASVASTGTTDPSSDNDTSDATSTAVHEDVQLSVTKTFSSDTVTAGGDAASFTIDVHNDGVSDADNVELTDLVDGRLVIDSIDNGSFDCTASSGQSVDCSLAHLAAGGTESVTVHYHVDSTTDGENGVENTATAHSDEDGPDVGQRLRRHRRGRPPCRDEDVRATPSRPAAPRRRSPSTSPTPASPTRTTSRSPTRSTAGSSSSRSMPAPTRVVRRASRSTARSATCPRARRSRSRSTTTSTPPPTAAPSATRRRPPRTRTTASNSDTVDIVEDVQLVVTKTFDSATVTAGGDPQAFTLSVKNDGVSDADQLNLSDTVDGRLIVDSVDAGSFTCPNGDTDDQTITCNLDHLAAHASESITVHYHVAASTAPDPNVGNTGSATSDEVVSPVTGSDHVAIVTSADLSVSKTGPSIETAGDPAGFDYTVTVHNGGPSDNTGGFQVTDTLASGLSFVAGDSDPACSATGQVVTCANTTGPAARGGPDIHHSRHAGLDRRQQRRAAQHSVGRLQRDERPEPGERHQQHDRDGRPRGRPPLGREDVRQRERDRGRAEQDVHDRGHEQRPLRRRQPRRDRQRRPAARRRLDLCRPVHVCGCKPGDRLHARPPRGGRLAVDRGHLQRRHDHRIRPGREQHGGREVGRGRGFQDLLSGDCRRREPRRHQDVQRRRGRRRHGRPHLHDRRPEHRPLAGRQPAGGGRGRPAARRDQRRGRRLRLLGELRPDGRLLAGAPRHDRYEDDHRHLQGALVDGGGDSREHGVGDCRRRRHRE